VPDLLRDYESTVGQIPGMVRRVRELTADNPTQQANCTRLENLIDRRISLGASSVELKKSGQSDLQKQSELTHQIVALSAEIDSLLQQMDGVEQHLLNLRTSDSARLRHATLAILATAFALALALLLIHYRLLNAESRARQQAELERETTRVYAVLPQRRPGRVAPCCYAAGLLYGSDRSADAGHHKRHPQESAGWRSPQRQPCISLSASASH